jgi:hypothetical protein
VSLAEVCAHDIAPPATWSGIQRGTIFRIDDWPFYVIAEVTSVRLSVSVVIDEAGRAHVRRASEAVTVYVIDGRTYTEEPLRPGTVLEYDAEPEDLVLASVSPRRPVKIRQLEAADVEAEHRRIGPDDLANIADRTAAWDAYGKSMAFGRQFAAGMAGRQRG